MTFGEVFALPGGRAALLCGACRTVSTLAPAAVLVCAQCGAVVTPAPGYPLVTHVPPQDEPAEADAGEEKLRRDEKRRRRRRKPVPPRLP